jgi:hypothetical protein
MSFQWVYRVIDPAGGAMLSSPRALRPWTVSTATGHFAP